MKTILEVVRDLIKPYIDKNANNIAPVEDSPVENPYYVGDQLIYKGVLYNVTSDIAIGDSLDIGTNISVAPKINSSVKSKLSSYSSDSTVWDTAPTANSTKPVTSGGIKVALDNKLATYADDATAWDTSPTSSSTKPVTSGGVKTELDKKLPTYASGASSWDTTPTASSTKPVTSGGLNVQFNAVTNEFADINNVLGAKNILPNGASTVTTNGITFTVNSNGSVKATGTATADAILVLSSSFYVGNGRKVILSGCPSGGSASKYCIQMTNANGTTNKGIDTGSGVTITADADNLGCRIVIKQNQALGTGGITFYPMVRPANIRNASYVPYAMTNSQLTTQIGKINSECIGWNTTAKNIGTFNIASIPTYVILEDGYYCIQMWSTIGTPHDVSIICGGVVVAAGYLTYAYQRINAYLPLRKGTGLTFTGNGDGVAISCMTGVFNP